MRWVIADREFGLGGERSRWVAVIWCWEKKWMVGWELSLSALTNVELEVGVRDLRWRIRLLTLPTSVAFSAIAQTSLPRYYRLL